MASIAEELAKPGTAETDRAQKPLYSWRWGGASVVRSEDECNCAQVLVLASLSQPLWGVAQKHALSLVP